MARIKLVAESLQEYKEGIKSVDFLNEEVLNESSKGDLEKFLKDPEKNQSYFLTAYAAQFSKKGGDKLKAIADKLDLETKKKYAKQSLEALQDSKKGYAWLKVINNQIVGGGALGVEKSALGKELGA